jgi:hypothetical protein
MKKWLIFLFLPFITAAGSARLPVKPDHPLIIQPFYVRDVYRTQIVNTLPFPVTVMTFRNFDNDRWKESKKYALEAAYKKTQDRKSSSVIMLGEKQALAGRYISVFEDPDCGCFLFDGNVVADNHRPLERAIDALETKRVYILSDGSDLAERREAALRKQLRTLTKLVYKKAEVTSATELRAQIISWNNAPRGILYINAFDLRADSGKRIKYRYIESVVTDFNKQHLEVGILREQHTSALAVGIDPADIGRAIVSAIKAVPSKPIEVMSSVNVARLQQLDLLYIATGNFKEAFLYEPIESR